MKLLKILVVDAGGGVAFDTAMDIAATGNKAFYLPSMQIRKGGWHGVNILPVASVSPVHLIDSVSQAVESVQPDAVLLLSEDQLFQVWDQSPLWLPLIHPVIEENFRSLYLSKHEMTRYIQTLGILVPRTIDINSGAKEEISKLITSFELPVVVKGARGAGGSQVRICGTEDEVLKAVAELQEKTGSLPALQEFIDGPEFSALGLFDRGRPLHLWINEKPEMYPPGTGPAIAVVSRRDTELLELARVLYRGLKFTGIACASFIRGPDGRSRFIEINPRIWGLYEFARILGIDLLGAWCRHLQGEELPEATDYPANRAWVIMPGYLFVDPKTWSNFLRRFFTPLALKSWAWTSPAKLSHQLRRTAWYIRKNLLKKAPKGSE